MKCKYSLRMTTVRCILVETTVPVRIRPRIETRPVKGHFLSAAQKRSATVPSQMFDPVRSSLTWPLKSQALSHSTTTTAWDHMGHPRLFVPNSIQSSTCRTYRCRCPQWRSWGYGNPDRPPCTIVGHPCPVGRSWFGSSSSGRCEAASGKRAPTGRSTRSP